jgi:hypothetical protein
MVEPLRLLVPPRPPSPRACRERGSTLVVICEIFNSYIGTSKAYHLFASDNAHGRVLADEIPDNASMTVETCVGLCDAANFTVAGIEFAVQCCRSSVF